MNRRTFLMTGAWLSSVTGQCFADAVSRGDHTLAIVDRSLACGPAFAHYAAHLKLPVFETGDDIGVLWYTTLASRVTPTSSLIGVTRASDYFVLCELANRAGLRAADLNEPHAPSANEHPHTVFTFTPRVLHHREA